DQGERYLAHLALPIAAKPASGEQASIDRDARGADLRRVHFDRDQGEHHGAFRRHPHRNPGAHSITLSALTSMVSGMASPISLAVFRLITNISLSDCSTGKLAGLMPARMRRTCFAARRPPSLKSAL